MSVILEPRFMPEPWEWSPDRLNPDFQSLAVGLRVLRPHWLVGNGLIDVTGRTKGTMTATPPSFVNTDIGRVLSFDGVNDRYTVADSDALTLPDGDWAIVFYMRIPDNSGTGFNGWYNWGAFSATPSVNLFSYESGRGDFPNTFRAWVKDGSGTDQIRQSTDVDFPSDWSLVVLQREGSGTGSLKWYINAVDRTGTLFEAGDIDDVDRSDALNIGHTLWALNAEIAYWGKWDRAMTVEEMRLVVDRPTGLITPTEQIWVPVSAGAINGQVAGTASARIALPNEVSEGASFRIAQLGEVAAAASVRVALPSEVYEAGSIRISLPSEIAEASSLRIGLPGEIAETGSVRIGLPSETSEAASLRVTLPSELSAPASIRIGSKGEVSDASSVRIGLPGEMSEVASVRILVPAEISEAASARVSLLSEVDVPASVRVALRSQVNDAASARVALVSESAAAASFNISLPAAEIATIEGDVVLLPSVDSDIELLQAVTGPTSLLPAVDGSAEILEVEV